MKLPRLAGRLAQWITIGAGVWFLVATASAHWSELTRLQLAPHAGPLLLASVLTGLTYVALVGGWVWSLRWWGQRLPYLEALRIWFLSNLARYIPGTLWQFVGLAAMCRARGVSVVAATASVLLQQVVLLSTGLVLTLGLSPRILGDWTASQSPVVWAGLVTVGLGLVIMGFPAVAPRLRTLAQRVAGRDLAWPAPPTAAFGLYVAAMLVPWIVYGVAFHLFAGALLGPAAPAAVVSVAAFVGSYVAGIIAVFAPGGLVVREAALTAALTPAIGAQNALFLAVTSRLWLVVVELATALIVLATHRVASPREAKWHA